MIFFSVRNSDSDTFIYWIAQKCIRDAAMHHLYVKSTHHECIKFRVYDTIN